MRSDFFKPAGLHKKIYALEIQLKLHGIEVLDHIDSEEAAILQNRENDDLAYDTAFRYKLYFASVCNS